MANLFDGYGDAELDPGLWFPLERRLRPGEIYDPTHPNPTATGPGPAVELKDSPIAFRIRLLPDNVDERITRKWSGNKLLQRYKKGAAIVEGTRDRAQAIRFEKAAWALRESLNAEVTARDEDLRKILTSALGREVALGEPVLIDGHLTDDLKRKLFDARPKLFYFVWDRAGLLAASEAEAEEGKEEG